MDHVLTLPLTPSEKKSFLIFFTPLFADIISKAVLAKLTIMLNTAGLKSEFVDNITADEQVSGYGDYCRRLGINNSTTSFANDGTKSFQDFSEKMIQELFTDGLIREKTEEMTWCNCGRVELPSCFLDSLDYGIWRKSLLCKKDGTVKCSICGQPLSSGKEKIYTINFPEVRQIEVLPPIYTDRVNDLAVRIAKHPTIISRRHRTGKKMVLNGEEIVVDTDFRWMSYLGYLGIDKNCHIVTGLSTLNQAVKVVAFNRLIYPNTRVSLVVHPTIKIKDGGQKLSGLRINDFLSLCDSADVARIILAGCIQWRHSESILNSDEMDLISKSASHVKNENWADDGPLSVDKLPNLINRQKIFEWLKCLRNHSSLTKQQMFLQRTICH